MNRLLIDKNWSALKKLIAMKAAQGSETYTENTVTGNPAVFSTNTAKALTGLTIPFTPIQSGTGDPSSTNIRPVSGISSVTISRSGSDTSNPTTYTVSFGEAGTAYGGELDAVTGVLTVTYISIDMQTASWSRYTGAEVPYFIMDLSDDYNYKVLPQPNVFCSRYSGANIGSTGSAEGILMLRAVCRIRDAAYADLESFVASLSDLQIAYELLTPRTVQLSPVTVQTLIGTNTVRTDTNGTNTVKYLTKD